MGIRPVLIAIEAAADVFTGNENDRAQVRQFIALLRRLALRTGAAVLLIAHPSLTGLASGTGTSGSTAWNNSVRSRLYFAGAKKVDDDGESDIRELKVMKSNYGPAGEIVRLRWQRGVFVPEGGPGMLERVAAEAAVDQAYLDCLDAAQGSGRLVGPYTGKAYAPAIFSTMPQANGFRAKALAAAQERLFNASRIEVQKVGPPSKALDRIFRKVTMAFSAARSLPVTFRGAEPGLLDEPFLQDIQRFPERGERERHGRHVVRDARIRLFGNALADARVEIDHGDREIFVFGHLPILSKPALPDTGRPNDARSPAAWPATAAASL